MDTSVEEMTLGKARKILGPKYDIVPDYEIQ